MNNNLKKHYGRPKKNRKIFYWKKDKEKKYQFCKTILEKNINYDEILFSYESKITIGSSTHNYICLVPLDQIN